MMMVMARQWVKSIVVMMLLVVGGVRAATVLTVDEKTIVGAIGHYENGALVLQLKSDETVTVPMEDVTQVTFTWQERVAATPSGDAESAKRSPVPQWWRVEFGETDRLTAELVGWDESGVKLMPEVVGGELVVPSDRLRAVWTMTESLVKKAKEISVTARGQDVAYVSRDGEVRAVAGFAVGCDGEFLNFKYEDKEQGIKLDRLVGLVLSQREIPVEKEMYQTFVLSAAGESISGKILSVDKSAFRVSVLGGGNGGGNGGGGAVPIAKVDKITVKNGRLVWLGDLRPMLVEEVPYLDYMMPYRVDQSLVGGALKMLDGVVDRGIAVHSKCFLTYDLGGAFEKLRMTVGFQHPEGKMGRAALRVVGDEKVLWEDLDAKGDAKPVLLDLNMHGVKKLRLEADYGKDQDVGDRVIWGDAKLTKPTK
ncbi:MAG: NPCBM/NEW2 domain-containing protein [Phycisphaerales bacterium]|nr:NPCBM/NEW2 domain-containing protein [Phycisphaerales bacterium]